jgi:hypothetical protein
MFPINCVLTMLYESPPQALVTTKGTSVLADEVGPPKLGIGIETSNNVPFGH